ncbi:MAG: DUF58 domain-containing protein [Planctomycetota bacterium]
MKLFDLLQPEDLARVAGLQWLAGQIVEGYRSGRHRSPHKGSSVEFRQHRPYTPGDQPTSIDWKAYAKSDRLYVREFEEETNLRCVLLVDQSGSMAYGGTRGCSGINRDSNELRSFEPRTKFDYVAALAAATTHLHLVQQDSVGLTMFDDGVTSYLPPGSKPSHLSDVIRVLFQNPPNPPRNETSTRDGAPRDWGETIIDASSKIPRRSRVVILSDTMGTLETVDRALARLRAGKHEVVLIQILDPDEVDFPFGGSTRFDDLELVHHQRTVDASAIRMAYLKRLEKHNDSLRSVCLKNRVLFQAMTTKDSIVDSFAHCIDSHRSGR